jgi:hypothetical protein
MTTITEAIRFKVRGGTTAALTALNEVPLARELIVATDTGLTKLGDGATAYNSLPFWTPSGVSSFNTRTGNVTLTYSDVTGALGFTPTTASGAVSAVAAAIGTGLAKSNGSALSAAAAGAGGDYVAPGAATGSGLTMATSRLLGRTTAASGAIEEISVGSGLTLASGTLSAGAIVIGQSAVAQSVTGTTTETTLATITIPAGLMGANGRIEIETLWSFTNSANNKIMRTKFGGTSYSAVTATTRASFRTSAFVANRNATNSQVGGQNGGIGTELGPYGTGTGSPTTTAIDTTSAVNITLTAQLANTGETITLEAYSVKLFK